MPQHISHKKYHCAKGCTLANDEFKMQDKYDFSHETLSKPARWRTSTSPAMCVCVVCNGLKKKSGYFDAAECYAQRQLKQAKRSEQDIDSGIIL